MVRLASGESVVIPYRTRAPQALKREETPSLTTRHRKAIAEAIAREREGHMKLSTRELAMRLTKYGYATCADVERYMEATRERMAFENGRDYVRPKARDHSISERMRKAEREEAERCIERISKSSTR